MLRYYFNLLIGGKGTVPPIRIEATPNPEADPIRLTYTYWNILIWVHYSEGLLFWHWLFIITRMVPCRYSEDLIVLRSANNIILTLNQDITMQYLLNLRTIGPSDYRTFTLSACSHLNCLNQDSKESWVAEWYQLFYNIINFIYVCTGKLFCLQNASNCSADSFYNCIYFLLHCPKCVGVKMK